MRSPDLNHRNRAQRPDSDARRSSYQIFWRILVATIQLERLPTAAVAVILLVIAWSVGVVWLRLGLTLAYGAGLIQLASSLGDWAMLALLPVVGRSYGPVKPPLLGLAFVRGFMGALLAIPAGAQPAAAPWWLIMDLALQVGLSVVAIYAAWVEPFRLGVTEVALRSSRLSRRGSVQRPIRLLHLADLHLERTTLRERQVIHLVRQLRPDIIVFTGDVLNLSNVRDPQAVQEARAIMRYWQAPYGVYAVRGSPLVDVDGWFEQIYAGLDHVVLLRDEVRIVNAGATPLAIVGVECTHDREADLPRLRRVLDHVSADLYTILLYHSPDLAPEAAAWGVDLYLCGHTHGGQIRLPIIGALHTSSAWWKRFEMGRYQLDGMTLYVSRGIGLEGMSAPRARFLAPPEVTLFTLEGERET